LHTKWTISLRYVDTELERPRWRSTLAYRVLPTLQIGAEFNPAAREVGPIATWFFLTEQGRRPAAFLGTSSDRIGSPKGKQAYYLTAAKNLDPVPASVYASLNYSEWDKGFNFPFGANVEVYPRVTIQPMYDGHRTHLLGSYVADRYGVTLIYAWFDRAGIAASVGF
jgi:hypothetical protein